MREHRNRTTMVTTISIRRSELRRGDAPGGRHFAEGRFRRPLMRFFRFPSRRRPPETAPVFAILPVIMQVRFLPLRPKPRTPRHEPPCPQPPIRRTAETRNRRRQNTRRPDPQSARQSAEESVPPHGRLYAKGDQDDLRIRSGRNPAHQKRNGHPEAGRTRPGGHYFRADQSRSAALAGQAGNRSRRLPDRLERLERPRPCAKSPERELLDPLCFSAPKPTSLRAVAPPPAVGTGGRCRSTLAGFARPVENARRPQSDYVPAENLR